LRPSSASRWSAGHATEHSIANAYIDAITNARHFVYIENQFFITATTEAQRPITNQIGRAIVDRIVRAHQSDEPFQVVVLMPAVPAFAGDLKSDGALGTRAIMEFQYNSISRGGHSIIESLVAAGVENPARYINFYNLRNYDRLNLSLTMASAERESGVRYESARREFDDRVEREPYGDDYRGDRSDYDAYQSAASRQSDTSWDSVAACYMANGPDIRSTPWSGSSESELDAFVSEELYIHSKVLIADDRLVICGSANLNDRSQLGDHDSEIAVVIEDTANPVESYMAGRPYTASRFAASLRRQLFRKHLGLLPHQPVDAADGNNWTPVSQGALNDYDWGSDADVLVADPLLEEFLSLWRSTARTNTEVFTKVFHPVPSDQVRNWEEYDSFFSRHFIAPGTSKEDAEKQRAEGRVDYGHVVREEFPGGVGEVKEWLSRVRGTLVEMPLQFLVEVEDLAKEGLSFNGLTDELYT
jgi:phospholipase D1/2